MPGKRLAFVVLLPVAVGCTSLLGLDFDRVATRDDAGLSPDGAPLSGCAPRCEGKACGASDECHGICIEACVDATAIVDGAPPAATCGCPVGQYCAAGTGACTAFKGSGHCRGDSDCGDRQACDLGTLTCVGVATNGIGCTNFAQCSNCAAGTACLGGACSPYRTQGSFCSLTRDTAVVDTNCPKDTTCALGTLTCQNVHCTTDVSCSPGRCDLGQSCDSTTAPGTNELLCFPYPTCAAQADCGAGGMKCEQVPEPGSGKWCTLDYVCQSSSECIGPRVCARGRCTPHYDVRCRTDADCDRPGLTCITAVGLCGRRS